jgi:hypothetical protein
MQLLLGAFFSFMMIGYVSFWVAPVMDGWKDHWGHLR